MSKDTKVDNISSEDLSNIQHLDYITDEKESYKKSIVAINNSINAFRSVYNIQEESNSIMNYSDDDVIILIENIL